MKRLVSTRNLSKEDWLRYRKCGITGTDAGAILGLNPYRSAFQVYHDKISDTTENIDNEAMRQGRDLEDYVAQRFTEATGLKVRRANAIYQSEEHPLLLADFDRLTLLCLALACTFMPEKICRKMLHRSRMQSRKSSRSRDPPAKSRNSRLYPASVPGATSLSRGSS